MIISKIHGRESSSNHSTGSQLDLIGNLEENSGVPLSTWVLNGKFSAKNDQLPNTPSLRKHSHISQPNAGVLYPRHLRNFICYVRSSENLVLCDSLILWKKLLAYWSYWGQRWNGLSSHECMCRWCICSLLAPAQPCHEFPYLQELASKTKSAFYLVGCDKKTFHGGNPALSSLPIWLVKSVNICRCFTMFRKDFRDSPLTQLCNCEAWESLHLRLWWHLGCDLAQLGGNWLEVTARSQRDVPPFVVFFGFKSWEKNDQLL